MVPSIAIGQPSPLTFSLGSTSSSTICLLFMNPFMKWRNVAVWRPFSCIVSATPQRNIRILDLDLEIFATLVYSRLPAGQPNRKNQKPSPKSTQGCDIVSHLGSANEFPLAVVRWSYSFLQLLINLTASSRAEENKPSHRLLQALSR